jgi:hypothetical protein
MLNLFSTQPFYSKYVTLPSVEDPVAPFIRNNSKFSPFFNDAIGAIDGTHFDCSPPKAEQPVARNRKGGTTQNCLAICDFDLMFKYIFSGWNGSASDSTMYQDARQSDLTIPAGKYYLADAGFPICEGLLIPYRGVRYHLQEWGRTNLRYVIFFLAIPHVITLINTSPTNAEELFNLRHAMARNVVERIFGILKARFTILTSRPRYNLDIVARLPAALAALHNFIRIHDPNEIGDFLQDPDLEPGPGHMGELADGFPNAAERHEANTRRDEIAQAMWIQYQEYNNRLMD